MNNASRRPLRPVLAALAGLLLACPVLAGAPETQAPRFPAMQAAMPLAPLFNPVFSRDSLALRPNVQLKSRSVAVVRADNGEVLYGKNLDRELPIASITKLMTAMVVLDAEQSPDEMLTITADDIDQLRHTTSRLRIGSRLSRGDLLLLALMASENRAASALLRNYPGGRSAGLAAMNRKAVSLGMTHTRFADGTGLSSDNRSTPLDLARLVKAADTYPQIRRDSTTGKHLVKVGSTTLAYQNTNPLVRSGEWDIALTKTGFTNDAGRCLVMQASIAGTPVILVLMDSVGKLTRVGDANRVRKWLEGSLSRNS